MSCKDTIGTFMLHYGFLTITLALALTACSKAKINVTLNRGEGNKSGLSTNSKNPTFDDTDMRRGVIAGKIYGVRSSEESSVSDYAVSWADSDNKVIGELAAVSKSQAEIIFDLVNATDIPGRATKLHFDARDVKGLSLGSVAIDLIDKFVPSVKASTNIVFSDSNSAGGVIDGTITFDPASNESDVASYVLYWGSSPAQKASGQDPIVSLPKTGNPLSYTFPSATVVPSDASYLLIYTASEFGENQSPVAIPLVDKSSVASPLPTNAAASVSFTDTDPNGQEISGNLQINKAANESDVTAYVIYWGSNATTKQSQTPIATTNATGSNLVYSFPANTSVPSGATHILVYTKNAAGEMTTGVSYQIVDLGVPTHAAASVAFTDTDLDSSQLGGNVTITKSANESDVTNYVLYWGTDASTKRAGAAIATYAVTGANITHTFAANTAIPTSPLATHILVYTANSEGEMATGVSVAITDKGIPIHAATSVSFTDTDLDGSQLAGTVTISKASNESDVTHYVLYWGSDATTKQSGTAIANIATTGSNVTYTFSANTAVPSSPLATHLLVYTKNADGEMATGVSVAITDLAVPTAASAGVTFTDSDTDAGQIGGTVTITKAANESTLTHYVLYWGADATTKQNTTAITTIAKTGANVTYNFAANTVLPSSPAATHLLVFTKNADGEMATGVNVAITDDSSAGGGGAPGTFTIQSPANPETTANPTITWSASSNATSYSVSVSTQSNCTSPVAEVTGVTSTSQAIGPILNGSFYACVTAINANGSTSATSVALTVNANPARVNTAFAAFAVDIGNFLNKVYFFKGKDASWSQATAMNVTGDNAIVGIAAIAYSSSTNVDVLATTGGGACCSQLRLGSSTNGGTSFTRTDLELNTWDNAEIRTSNAQDMVSFSGGRYAVWTRQYTDTTNPKIYRLMGQVIGGSQETIEDLDFDNDSVMRAVLGVGSAGKLYLAYMKAIGFGGTLKIYIRERSAGGVWGAATEYLDASCNSHSLDDFVVEPTTDKLHVLYQCSASGSTRTVYRVGTTASWTSRTEVANNGNDTINSRMFVDTNGKVHITRLNNGSLEYRTNAFGRAFSTIDSVTSSAYTLHFTAPYVDANGIAYIGYAESDATATNKYMAAWAQPGSTWNSQSIYTLSGEDPSSIVRRIVAVP